MKKLYVGNLSFQTTEADLTSMFEQHGVVESARIITDRDTGRSKGFGFVEMSDDDAAEKAIAQLNGQQVSATDGKKGFWFSWFRGRQSPSRGTVLVCGNGGFRNCDSCRFPIRRFSESITRTNRRKGRFIRPLPSLPKKDLQLSWCCLNEYFSMAQVRYAMVSRRAVSEMPRTNSFCARPK
jgi:RNA recognition motif